MLPALLSPLTPSNPTYHSLSPRILLIPTHLFQMGKLRQTQVFLGDQALPHLPSLEVPLCFLPKTHLLGKEAIAIAGRDIPPFPFPWALPPVG